MIRPMKDVKSARARSAARTVIVAAALVLASLTPAHGWDIETARRAEELLGEEELFAAALYQDGTVQPVNNQPVTLRRAPFAVLVVTPEPGGILLNASPIPNFYDGIRSDRSIPEILDEPDLFMGMAEWFFNPDRELYVSTLSPHYLFFTSFEQHRYDFVHLTPDAVIGYRSVAFLRDIDGEAGVLAIDEWAGPLYLSFYATVFEDGARIELQSRTVRIDFR